MGQARLRKHLSTPGLLGAIRETFAEIADEREARCEIPLVDALMSGLAVFALKFPSLLKFDESYRDVDKVVRSNLKALYGVGRAPCDTQLRTRLDTVNPATLRPAFRSVHRHLQRHKALEAYTYLDGHYLVSIDGTGQYASSSISCPECCRKTVKGETQYYHQLLAAVLVHPELTTVLPFMPEAITRQDGSTKNDCERNAAKRLLKALRREYPKLKLIVVEDALASNGPHIELLESLDLHYILGAKPGDHPSLFGAVQQSIGDGSCQEKSEKHDGTERGYRWCNDIALNKSHPERRVNFLEYWEIADGKQRVWAWVTDIKLSKNNVEAIMRGGRARWKIENETFNTLKNQGYGLEHNYGHGQRHLATVFATLTMLAFLVDQAQEHGCRMFQQARDSFRSRTSLWERVRAYFVDFYIPDWQTLWQALANPTRHVTPTLTPDTS